MVEILGYAFVGGLALALFAAPIVALIFGAQCLWSKWFPDQ